MDDQFNTACINVLDETMMEWFIKFCPEFMFVEHKPHCFGNENHVVCGGLTSIMW